jgi:chitinase
MPEKKINDKRIIVYYPYWNPQYRSSKIPLQKVTHICHSFIAPTTQGEINYSGGFLEPDLIDDAHRAGVKVLVSIGGADQTATAALRRIACSEELKKMFAENVEKNF